MTLPTAAGLAFFLDPLLRKRGTSGGGIGRRDAEGFLPVTPLAAIPADGRPQIFTVYDDVVDAWNKFANQPVGRVFLRRLPDGSVTAFNVRCPHLGCAVDYRPSQNDYLCPCHMSAFELDGQKKNEIPPRDLDSLRSEGQGQIRGLGPLRSLQSGHAGQDRDLGLTAEERPA